MGNVDSLSIKVDTSARSANQQLDKLVQKMVQLRSTVNGINLGNLNKMAGSIQNFSKAVTGLRGVKTSDFTRMAKGIEKLANVNSSNLDKSAQSVERAAGSLQRASSVSKRAISSGLKFDSSGVQDMQRAIKSLSNQFSDAGKGKIFEGTLSDLEKSADKLRNKLGSLAEKEEKILAVEGTSGESKVFKNLQYDISKTLNQLSQVEEAIAKVRATEKQDNSSIPIFRWDAPTGAVEGSGLKDFRTKVQETFQSIPESAKYSVGSAQKSLEGAMKEVHMGDGENAGFRNYTEEIKTLKAELNGLEQSGRGMGSDEWERVYLKLRKVKLEAQEYKHSMDNPVTGLDEDIKKTDSLGNRVEGLKAKVKALQEKGLNFGDPKFDSTYRELQKATGELRKYKSSLNDAGNVAQSVSKKIADAFRSIWNVTKKAGSGVVSFGSKVKSLTTRFHSMSSSTSGLIGKIMKLYIAFRSFRSVGNFLKDSVDASMDYIEEYNYFNTTMEKIASEWSKDYKKYGYQSAEKYGKSFKNRLTQTMGKMTGFKMENDGTLTDSKEKNLGLDATQMTNYAAGIAQVTNSVGLTGEASVATSKALSMLAGDMSSFRNLDMKTVMNNFSSGLIGQSRSLYKYGIDITNATLATYAHSMGIKKNIQDMTQAEKMQLRMIAILDQSKVAWGDLAKTINSPSNQLRLLRNNFNSLARTIGNMFLPVVAKVLPYVNGLVIAIRRLFEWTASMLGISLKDVIGGSGGGYSDAFDGLEEDAENAKDKVDDTTDSVKKLAKQLMGFDELNVITTNKDSDKDKDGSDTPIDLTDQLSAALADYEKVWNDAYKNMTSDAEKFADKLTKLFKDAWTSGDGTDIGTAIASWINKGIAWVNKNVDTFAEGLKKMAGIMATAFNGFVAKLDWAGLGTAIGKSLKAFFDAETHFFDTVDWVNFGSSLATALNTAIDSGVIQSYIKSIASKLRAAIEFAFGAITTFDFSGLGKAIGQGINDFFDKMGKVNPKTGLNGWQELGVSITEGISGIADTIITALDTVKWEEVGQAIANFIESIDFDKIGWKITGLTTSLEKAIAETIKGVTGLDISVSTIDIAVKFGAINWAVKGITGTSMLTAAKNSIIALLTGAGILKGGNFSLSLGSIKNLAIGLASSVSIAIPSPLTDEFVREIEMWLTDNVINKVSPLKAAAALWNGFCDVLVDVIDTAGSIIVDAFTDALDISDFKLTGNDMADGFMQGFTAVLLFPATLINSLILKPIKKALGINSPSKKFKEIGKYCVDGFIEGLKSIGGSIKEKIESAWNTVVTWAGNNFKLPNIKIPSIGDMKKNVLDKWTKVTSWWKTAKSALGNIKVPGIGNIKSVVSKAWQDVTSWWKTAKNKLSDIKIPGIGSIKDKVVSAWKTAKTWWKENVVFPAFKFTEIAKDTAKKWLKPVVEVLNSIIDGFNKLMKLSWGDFKIMGKKIITKGSFTLLTIPKIQGFKDGGFPTQGQYFLARENGPELVGTVGGKSAVMNNKQIERAVSDAVFNALAPVLTQVVNSVNALNSKMDNMGGNGVNVEKYTEGDLLRVIRNEDSNYRKRTGKSAFAH